MSTELRDEWGQVYVEVHGVCSECKEHCSGALYEEKGEAYSECCGADVYSYERGEG